MTARPASPNEPFPTLRLTRLAVRDINDAIDWYESIRRGLGDALLMQLEAAVAILARYPDASPRCVGEVRRKLLRRFPYAVYYRPAHDGIQILGVRPTAADPETVPDRLVATRSK